MKNLRPEVKVLRENIYNFIHKEILTLDTPAPVLEIGPMDKNFTPVKEYFVDTKKYFNNNNIKYISCDCYPDSGCDIIGSVMDIEQHVKPESVGSVIALEVIEHTPEMWLLPDIFHNILKPGGKLFLSVPYHFYRHAPFPDYWRISEDGLKLLFGKKFDIKIEACHIKDKNGNIIDDRKPIDYTMVAVKKAMESKCKGK